ncbi:hypothetical protein [Chloroflexus sp. Y-396-1]|uniref:hypothetical protein n=1 Tax=Chloroflexus sp. Y-396-1 TaxID=867845 RepID=UPI00049163F4|nr:hypothetical protein [Chloroflexus sp. Y-396-1]
MNIGTTIWPPMPARPQALAASWSSFDHGALREFLQRARDVGIQQVRFELRWAEVQPGPQRISVAALNGFQRGLDLAQSNHLQVVVSLMSATLGPTLHLPDWTLGIPPQALTTQSVQALLTVPPLTILDNSFYRHEPVRDLYTDPDMRSAQRYLLREVVGNFADHPVIAGWLLAAGFERVRTPTDHRDMAAWWADLAEQARANGANQLFGYVDATTLSNRASLRPYDIAMAGGMVVVSVGPWPPLSGGPPARGEAACFCHAIVAGLLAEEINDSAAAQVVVADLGWPTAPVSNLIGWQADQIFAQSTQTFLADEEAAATALQESLVNLARAGAAAVWLASLVDPSDQHWNVPPFDRSWVARTWGLWTANGRPKAAWDALREVINRLPTTKTLPTLPIDPERYWRDPATELRRLWREYRSEAASV